MVVLKRWVIDLDGVMWRGVEPIDGSASAIGRLVEAGDEVIFCTNHASAPSLKQQQLAAMSVPDAVVLTSAEVAASCCATGERVLVVGEPELFSVINDAGVDVTDVVDFGPDGPIGPFDVVVVGSTSKWDRSLTGLAADAVRGGARLIGTNSDPTYPVIGPDGPRLLPGAGALIAAVETTSGASAVIVGKPHQPTVDLIIDRYGPVDLVVGDKPETDGELAVGLGAEFVLVLSGVTSQRDLPVRPHPKVVADSISEAVDQVLGRR